MAPTVRKVSIRIMGDDDAAREVADVLAMLPALTQDRMQLGEVSKPYPMRDGAGVRYYVDAYLVDHSETRAKPGKPSRPAPPRRRGSRPLPSHRRELEA